MKNDNLSQFFYWKYLSENRVYGFCSNQIVMMQVIWSLEVVSMCWAWESRTVHGFQVHKITCSSSWSVELFICKCVWWGGGGVDGRMAKAKEIVQTVQVLSTSITSSIALCKQGNWLKLWYKSGYDDYSSFIRSFHPWVFFLTPKGAQSFLGCLGHISVLLFYKFICTYHVYVS